MRSVERNLTIAGRFLVVSMLAVLLVWGGACSLFNKGENSGDVQGQPAVLEPVAGRLSQVTGGVAIDHQIDLGTTNGTQPADGTNGSQPVAQPTAYQQSQPAAPPVEPNEPPPGQPAPADQGAPAWTQAANNMPLTVGDRIYVPQGGQTAVGFSGRKYVRVDPGSTLDVIALSKDDTQLALRSGSAMFDIGELQSGEHYEVDTPASAIDFTQPGLYQVGFNQDGSVVLTVLNGQAQVISQGGSETVSRGQVITLPAAESTPANAEATAAPEEQPVVADVSPDVCGNIVNDYYSYRYGSAYDGRYANYNTYLSDPYYYDPYQRSESYQYCGDDDYIAGLNDLNGNGDWVDAGEYGHCWFPHVAAGWVPYQSGFWVQDGPLGMSWCASEPWGWAPYHYGRWAYVNNRWGWSPALAVSEPIYSPALVAFVSLGGAHAVGWCPLGPGDPWVPHYYGAGFRPYYVGSEVSIGTPRNLLIAGAVTAVAVAALTRPISPAIAIHVDAGMLHDAHPVLDPYRDPSFRQASVQLDSARPRAFVPAAQQQVFNRPVFASNKPNLPGPLANSAPVRNVQALPSNVQKQRLAVNRSATAVAVRQPNGLPMAAPEVRGQQGNQPPVPPGQNNGQNPGQQSREQQQQAKAQQKAAQQQQLKQERQQQAQQQQLQQQQAKQQRQQQAQQQQQARQQQAAQQQQARQQQATQQQQLRQQRQQQATQQRQQQAAQQQQLKQQRQQQAAQQRQQQAAQQQQLKQQRQQQAAQQHQQEAAQQQQRQQQRQQQATQQRQQQAQQRQQQQAAQRQQRQQQQSARQQQHQQARQRQQQPKQQARPSAKPPQQEQPKQEKEKHQ